MKGVQAALHLQSQQNANQYINTDGSATITLTEDEFNDDTRHTEDSTDKESWVSNQVSTCAIVSIVSIFVC